MNVCQDWFFYNNSQEIHWLYYVVCQLVHWCGLRPIPTNICYYCKHRKKLIIRQSIIKYYLYLITWESTKEQSAFWCSVLIETYTQRLLQLFVQGNKVQRLFYTDRSSKSMPFDRSFYTQDADRMIWKDLQYIDEEYQTIGIFRNLPKIEYGSPFQLPSSSYIRILMSSVFELLWASFDLKKPILILILLWRYSQKLMKFHMFSLKFPRIYKLKTWLPWLHLENHNQEILLLSKNNEKLMLRLQLSTLEVLMTIQHERSSHSSGNLYTFIAILIDLVVGMGLGLNGPVSSCLIAIIRWIGIF